MSSTIKTKLRVVFIGLAAFIIGLGAVAIDRMGLLNGRSTEMEVNWIPSMIFTAALHDDFSQYMIATALHIQTTDDAGMAVVEQQMVGYEKDMVRLRGLYEPLINSDEEAGVYREFSGTFQAFLAQTQKIVALSRKNQNAQAGELMKTEKVDYDKIASLLDKLVEINRDGAVGASHESTEIFVRTRYAMMVGIGAIVLMCLWLAVMLERSIARPIAALSRMVERVAAGDLQVEIAHVERRDEVGMIARSVATTVTALQRLVGELRALIGEARLGNLSVRAEVGDLKGEFADLLTGGNELLDVLSKPLAEVAQVMQRLASGDLKDRMTSPYEGDLRALKVNVNRSLDALVSLLTELGTLAAGMAGGDLRRTLEGAYQGEFAGLKGNFNQAVTTLREVLSTLSADTTQVSTAVGQTTAAARQVAEATAGQMATLGEISAAITQTAAAVTQLSSHANESSALARSTVELAADGRQRLERLASEIEDIAQRQSNIDRITATITRIADKTQVLSINAGIEAARVGDKGRGFGVVAHEIGRLAEETALAARDIGVLIAEAGLGVQRTVGGVGEARQTMERIAAAAQSAGAASGTMAAAMVEQASTVEVLSQRSDDLRRGGESNAAAIEEISVTMEELARMAHHTRTEMAHFVLC